MEGAFLPEGKTHPRRLFQYYVCVAKLSYHSVKQKTIVFPIEILKDDEEM